MTTTSSKNFFKHAEKAELNAVDGKRPIRRKVPLKRRKSVYWVYEETYEDLFRWHGL